MPQYIDYDATEDEQTDQEASIAESVHRLRGLLDRQPERLRGAVEWFLALPLEYAPSADAGRRPSEAIDREIHESMREGFGDGFMRLIVADREVRAALITGEGGRRHFNAEKPWNEPEWADRVALMVLLHFDKRFDPKAVGLPAMPWEDPGRAMARDMLIDAAPNLTFWSAAADRAMAVIEASGTSVEIATTGATGPRHVTLDQAAAWVNRSKRTLERHKGKGLPEPAIRGGGGKPSEWIWSELRPWLEETFDRRLPVRLPDGPFRSGADRN